MNAFVPRPMLLVTVLALLLLSAASPAAAEPGNAAPEVAASVSVETFLASLANPDAEPEAGAAQPEDGRILASHATCQQLTGCGFYPSTLNQNSTYCSGKCPTVCEDPEWSGYYQSSTGCCICTPPRDW